MSKKKKRFRDTKVGSFLIGEKGLFKELGDILPDSGFLGVLKGLIAKENSLTPHDKETALKMLEIDVIEMQNITSRWQADLASDSWLSKNVRPLMISYLTVMTTLFVILDSSQRLTFDVPSEYIELLKNLLITAYLAYFGSRGFEKYKSMS